MTDLDQKQLGKMLCNIADTRRGAMNVDDFRDGMLSFSFIRKHRTQKTGAHKNSLIQKLFPSPEGMA